MREEEDTTRGKRDFLLQFFSFFLGGSVFFFTQCVRAYSLE